MTRQATGVLHNSCRRSRNNFLIGHLSTKSSVYSPTSMSRMSQDLVYNHMKSHYQRISSAKACIDTSAPKSMKLTIKGKDRKRRESLQNPFQTASSRPSSRLSSRPSSSQKYSQMKQEGTRDIQDEPCSPRTLIMDHTNRADTENMSMMNGIRGNKQRTDRTNGRESQYNHTHSRTLNQSGRHREDLTSFLYNGFTEDSLNFELQRSRNNEKNSNLMTEYGHASLNGGPSQKNTCLVDHSSPRLNHVYTSTPQLERGDEQDEVVRNETLQMSNISFSYKSPPSPRSRNKKRSEEIIWTEEQKYLHFISEVTDDVLARGIFSNRVLNRVFESHIEKRKGDLDEEHMREMIEQLKQDLDITD